MQGCYFWAWFVAVEMQLMVIVPFYVLALFKVKSFAGKMTLLAVPFVGAIVLNYIIAA